MYKIFHKINVKRLYSVEALEYNGPTSDCTWPVNEWSTASLCWPTEAAIHKTYMQELNRYLLALQQWKWQSKTGLDFFASILIGNLSYVWATLGDKVYMYTFPLQQAEQNYWANRKFLATCIRIKLCTIQICALGQKKKFCFRFPDRP